MGYKVVTVEAFYENILRIHKASYLDKTFNNIVLIHNALSNKRNEIKMLQPYPGNIGAQSLLPFNNQKFLRNKTNKYLVETILFDDILPYLPYRDDAKKEKYKKAALKTDIEGFEPFAFEHADQLFDKLNIEIILMEWYNIQKLNETTVNSVIGFLKKRNYIVYYNNKKRLHGSWKNWPFNIVWRKED